MAKYIFTTIVIVFLFIIYFFYSDFEKKPIRIGILHSFSGAMASIEKSVSESTLLAIEELNTDGGLLGRKIEVVWGDGKSDPEVFAKEADRLINVEHVSVIFGCWTSKSRKAVKTIVEKNNHLLFYPAQYEGFESSPNIIYTGTIPNQQVIPATNWATQKFGKKVYSSSKALLGILNDILDYSKIESGNMQIEKSPLDLHKVLEDISSLFAAQLIEKSLELKIELEKSVPGVVLGDSLRLSQVLNNLVGNSVKFTNQGQINIKVSSESLSEDELLLKFAVQDTGIGLPPEKIDSLFNAFTQADNSITRKYGGTGLGLAICRKLVTLMGGEIGVISEEGHGATFSFTIKVGKAKVEILDNPITGNPTQIKNIPQINLKNHFLHCSSQTKKNTTKNVHTEFKHFSGKKVLLAEDNLINQKIARVLLERQGIDVTIANDGKEAIEAAKAGLTGAPTKSGLSYASMTAVLTSPKSLSTK